MQKCRTCLRELEDSAYRTRKMARGRIALQTRCRECDNAYQRAYSASNPERKRGYMRAYNERHPGANTAHHKKWAQGPLGRAYFSKEEYKSRVKAYYDKWKVRNAKKVREYGRDYFQRHPERARAHACSVAARAKVSYRRNEPDDTTDYMVMIAKDPCYVCGVVSTDWDHVEAIATGGKHIAENIARLCEPCNTRKHARKLIPWLILSGWRGPTHGT